MESIETGEQTGELRCPALTRSPPCELLCHYVNAISNSSRNIGKEGKFQLFVCLGIRQVAFTFFFLFFFLHFSLVVTAAWLCIHFFTAASITTSHFALASY